jgi:hypothetical protein
MNFENPIDWAGLATVLAGFFLAFRMVRRKILAQRRFVALLASPEVAPSLENSGTT